MQYFVEERFHDIAVNYPPEPKTKTEEWQKWLLQHDDAGAARVYIVASAAVSAVLVWMPYEVLITFTMTLMAIPTILFLVAFVLLREQKPDLARDFKIPGSTLVAALVALPPGLLTIAQAFFSLRAKTSDETSIPYPAAFALIVIVGGGLVVHGVAILCGYTGGKKNESWMQAKEPLLAAPTLQGVMTGL